MVRVGNVADLHAIIEDSDDPLGFAPERKRQRITCWLRVNGTVLSIVKTKITYLLCVGTPDMPAMGNVVFGTLVAAYVDGAW